MHECACEIDDVEALVQSPCVHTRGANDNLHTFMSVMYIPNLAHIHIDVRIYEL